MSVIKLSKSAYFHNLEQILKRVGSKDKIFAVLKDNAYGHGSTLIASLAKEFGIKKAVVRTQKEANEILEFFDEILILSQLIKGDENADERLIYAINDISAISVIKSGAKVHLALDTLMHRHGLKENELENAFKIAKERKVRICGAYTHFCCADEMSAGYEIQRSRFAALKSRILEFSKLYDMGIPVFHSHNSAATERDKNTAKLDECVRVGIAQYGYAQFDESLNLKPVMSLWAHKISTRVLKTGECVGYGGVFCASKDTRISTYDLGYGDGLLRYNGKGELLLANKSRILGRMSMDSFSADSTDDEICVFDDANLWAKHFGTINYDILVKLSPSIDRIIV